MTERLEQAQVGERADLGVRRHPRRRGRSRVGERAGLVALAVGMLVGLRAFSAAQGLAAGTQRQPSRARSIALSGDRIVIESIDRSGDGRTPMRLDSPDLGQSWSRVALPDGLRSGDLEKVDFRTSRLKELLHRDGPRVDVLRARYEQR